MKRAARTHGGKAAPQAGRRAAEAPPAAGAFLPQPSGQNRARMIHRRTPSLLLLAALLGLGPLGAHAAPAHAAEADGAGAPALVEDDTGDGETAEAAPVDEEMAAMRAAEAAAIAGDNLLDLDRAVRLLGPGNPWRTRIAGSLDLDASEWPAVLEALDARPARAALGELPFPVSSVAARYDIPVAYNAAVAEYIAFFQGPGRRYYERWLARSGRYVPLFREILREHGVPEDLVYLSMIESGFSMHARSWAAAVGPWQFIEGTGAMYGLRNDFWVDERQDPVKSTRAAARFLKRLHDAWGNWYLAWAGYNAGPGRVKKAIDRFGTHDFWELASSDGAFRQETQHYVPKLIAAALIAKHPEHFGFESVELEPPLAWETVELPDAVDLAVIARCAGVTVEQIQELNPELRRWATPPVEPGGKPYALRLPVGTQEQFAENFARVKPSERLAYRGYKVRSGDTLGAIAIAFDTSVEAIMRSNGIKNARALRVGQELVIPMPPEAQGSAPGTRHARVASSPAKRVASASAAASGRHHVLRAGETLGHVALRYGVSVDQLKRLNGIRDVRKVRVGQTLRVR